MFRLGRYVRIRGYFSRIDAALIYGNEEKVGKSLIITGLKLEDVLITTRRC